MSPSHHDDLLGPLLDGPGHSHEDPLRPTADVSVRPALPEDAEAIGRIHARTLRATLIAGTGQELPADVAAAVEPAALARAWSAAVTAPPGPGHRVLSAMDGGRVVGFAAIAPAETEETAAAPPDVDDGSVVAPEGGPVDTPEGPVGEILALEVPAADARRGHGSRLLAACVDLLREQGAQRVQVWSVQGDESRERFLAQAGFAPAGLRRRLDVAGAEAVEICWYAEL